MALVYGNPYPAAITYNTRGVFLKKKIIIIVASLLIIAGVVLGAVAIVRNNKIEGYKRNKGGLPMNFTYTAHTGCCGTEDNSIASIEKGASHGAQIVEFDLRFDENETPVLCHDEVKGGEVTLEEAFKKISEYDNLRVNVDAKSCEALWKVQELAGEYNVLNRIFFTGIEEKDVDAVKMSAPAVDYYLNMSVEKPSEHTEEYLQTLVDKVKECGAIGINFNKKSASKELVDYFHANGLLVSIFTVDDKVEMYKILSYAPDNITTRCPDDLQEILKEF